jgi:regulator of protease activity HflC (stomatin/prohibitin superfamily)
VFKYKHVIVHELTAEHKILEGEAVECKIDKIRRMQLAQHHTATHIMNAAARTILGNHINQAGAKKTVEKAHIDITHFQNLTEQEIQKIEQEAKAYRYEVVYAAQGDVLEFNLILPRYKSSPDVIRTRIYIDVLENILMKTTKIFLDLGGENSLVYLPIDRLFNTSK